MHGSEANEHVLLEVENLTADERAQVQDGLTSIQSDITERSQQQHTYSDSEMITDLSGLINICYRHQSEEEACAVHVAWDQTGGHQENGLRGNLPHSDLDEESPQVHPHRPTTVASEDTERRQLTKKINSIVKASAAVSTGESMGLNCRAQWNTDKVAAGSTLAAGEAITATGNSANAQASAQKAAQVVGFFSYNCDLTLNSK